MNTTIKKIIFAITIILLLAGTYLIYNSPVPIDPGTPFGDLSDPVFKQEWDNYANSFKIFYFHIPIAWVSYLAFFVTFIASIGYLKTKNQKWDITAKTSAEIGVITCGLTLVSGMIWGKAAWNVYWEWNPRLTLVLVLFLLYVAYNLVRQAMDSPEVRARTSAVFGIIAFIAVPLSYLSIKLWETRHPDLTSDSGGIDGSTIVMTLVINIIAYTFLYVSLFILRSENEIMREEIEYMKRNEEM